MLEQLSASSPPAPPQFPFLDGLETPGLCHKGWRAGNPSVRSARLRAALGMAVQSLAPAALLLAVSITLARATKPGIVARITGPGLDYALQKGISALEKKLAEMKLPDLSGSQETPVGDVYYEFSRLNLRSFRLPSSQITPLPDVGVQVSVSNAFAQLTGNWRWKRGLFGDDGQFNLKVTGLSISVGLQLGRDASGKPTVTASGCTTCISDVDVDAGWIYKLIIKIIKSHIKALMQSQVCREVRSFVSTQLQPYLHALPVTAAIDTVAGVDYSLVAFPVATAQYVDVSLKGEIFSRAHRAPAPFSPPALAFPPEHGRMVYLGVSSYVFNTASFVYQAAGCLVFSITDDVFPKEGFFHLNTSTFYHFVPQLKQRYPDRLMKLQLTTPSAPFLTIAPGGLELALVADVQAYAILPNASLTPLFLLHLTSNVSASVTVSSARICGALASGGLELSLKHSDIGPFPVLGLQQFMNFLASNILLPLVNGKLEKGFPLPLPAHVQLSSCVLQPHQDFLLLGADVRYGL
ncbi:bactericidal permeability-increasing protein isoform X2 [Alligator mississippiensis]|uniref:bactericidal permeability-increasing protein isoform X2 n=1 Tax=Alligator mississippiensis TaxID=8496 RepID=UPI0028779EA1|nr:bactericidal permeability-increasing protein isoform X2 [Alligator mississippiensis]